MKQLLGLFLLFCFTYVCKAEQPKDTIDNWQIYLGKELLFAGNANMKSLPEIVIDKQKIDLAGKLRIVYNHCLRNESRKEIQFGDESGKRFTQRYFSRNQSILIKLAELKDDQKVVLYFYDGPITMPGEKARGTPILKLKFM